MTFGLVPLQRAWTALLAGAIVLGMDVVYVLVLRSEGEGDLHRAGPQLIAASLAACAAIAAGAWFVREPRVRLALLVSAAFTLLAWGFLALFSIGLPVFVAGILLLVSVGRAADDVSAPARFAITVASSVVALLLVAAVVTAA
jgi:hypothetical protein